MRKQVCAISFIVLLVPLLSVAQVVPLGVTASIEFSFHAAGQVLPPGTYECKTLNESTTLQVTNTKTGSSILVPILTMISKKPAAGAEVVFDKKGNDFYLSEVFIPGSDGLLLEGVKGQHTHVSVKATKKSLP